MKRIWTEEMRQFVVDNVFGTPMKDLTDMVNAQFGLNLTPNAVKSYCTKNGFRNGRPKKPCPLHLRLLTENQAAFVEENCLGTGPKEMAQLLNKKYGTRFTVKQIKGYYHNHHLHSGVTGYFEKGHEPMNKGRKQTEYMSPEAIERTAATRFHKGNLPHNTKPIGYERITVDGYVEVKIAMRPSAQNKNDNFPGKHVLAWEAENGPIPEGYCLRFLDGNKQNCSIDNLALVSRAEHIEITRRNLAFDNPELTKTGIAVAKLNVAAFERKKEWNGR